MVGPEQSKGKEKSEITADQANELDELAEDIGAPASGTDIQRDEGQESTIAGCAEPSCWDVPTKPTKTA